MDKLKRIVEYLATNDLLLATAESCTAGLVVSELARIPGSGESLDCGLTVYSPKSKHRHLKVSFDTMERYGLTSEEVARELAEGAINRNNASIALSNTGVAGPEPGNDGTPPGTVCFAWAVRREDKLCLYSEICHFDGDRNKVRLAAAHYVLERLPHYHQQAQEQQ